jgi:hypothetical protein
MPEELGMYAMHDMKPGTVRIGDFVLCKQSEGKIWIQHDSGEGGEFSEDSLHASLKKHYDEHF